jgi:pseudouridine kinase
MFMMTSREQEILALIRKDPMILQQEIARRLGISRSAVAGHIMKLTNKGIIKGRGYVVSDTPFVAVIGGANMDIHGKPARALRRHDSNPGMVHSSPGGVARNIAENLARLGADCRLISAIGNDHYGQLLLQQCRDAGIDMQHVQQIDSAQTSTYLSVLDGSGDMHVAINDMAIIEELRPERLRSQETMLKQAALIILDTNLCDDTLAWLTDTLAEKTIFVDAVSTVKAKKIKPYLAAIHTLKTSLIEAEALSGLRARTQAERRKLAAWAHGKGVSRLFITLGEDGVFYSTNDAQGVEKLQREKKTMENAGGAGDAFLGGLAYAWLKDWAMLKSVRFALAAAEVTLSDRASSSSAVSLTAVNRVYESQHVS